MSDTLQAIDVRQLIALYDSEFVFQAYRSVLGREPDAAGFENYLQQVRSGVPKEQLIVSMARSDEGVQHAATMQGLRELLSTAVDEPAPLLRRLAKRFDTRGIAQAQTFLRVIDNRLYGVEQQMVKQARQMDALLALLERNMATTAGVASPSSALSATEAPQAPAVSMNAPPMAQMSPLLARTFDQLRSMVAAKRGR